MNEMSYWNVINAYSNSICAISRRLAVD